jgi:hypothetical protein
MKVGPREIVVALEMACNLAVVAGLCLMRDAPFKWFLVVFLSNCTSFFGWIAVLGFTGDHAGLLLAFLFVVAVGSFVSGVIACVWLLDPDTSWALWLEAARCILCVGLVCIHIPVILQVDGDERDTFVNTAAPPQSNKPLPSDLVHTIHLPLPSPRLAIVHVQPWSPVAD